jgi:hypothetical protein
MTIDMERLNKQSINSKIESLVEGFSLARIGRRPHHSIGNALGPHQGDIDASLGHA